MGNRVQRIRTEVSTSQMVQAIKEAWQELFGSIPTKSQIALILSQNALETGHRKNMWNYNVGNITDNGKSRFDYFDDLVTDEQVKPKVWKKMRLKYRAYPSLKEGVKDYLSFLKNKRYAKAWQHLIHTNPVEFSKALKEAGYYTADEQKYTQSLDKLYKKFNKTQLASVDKIMPEISNQPIANDIINMLDKYLRMVAAADKRMQKQLLPSNNILVKVISNDLNNSIEFARILCSALEEELSATAYTHTNNQDVEINCIVPGPASECLQTVDQLSLAVSDAFKEATQKLGSINIHTQCILNKKSTLEILNSHTAESHYRRFLLKFI